MFKNWERSRLVLRASFSTVVLLLVAFLMYPNFLPGRSFAEPGVAANPTISITPSNTATMTLSPGTFGSVSQTITATTTNYTGYVLTMTTGGDSTNLVNTEDSTLLLPTITLPSGQTSITSANFVANTYGYSLNGTDYKPAPALNEADVIITTNAANTNADTSTLTFGAIVDLTATPGTYQNTFLLSATANDVGYMVSYVANANGDTVTGMPSPNPEPEPTSGLSVNLSDAEPERDGYRFVGWAEDSEANEPDYAPGDELALDPETANITTLYAVWKKLYTIIYVGNDADGGSMNMVYHEDVVQGDIVNLYASNFDRTGYGFLGWSFDEDAAETIGTYNASRIYGQNEEITAPDYVDNEYSTNDNLIMPLFAIWLESSGDIQDWAGCNSMSTGDVVALTDTRDNNTYAISKLGDGNCWMMENMRLSLDSVTINGDNTNNPTDSFATNYSGAASKPWSSWGSTYWQNSYNNNNTNRSLTPSPTNNDDNSSWYSYGVYYSWTIAMAGNTTELSGDLCPSGWRFPTRNEIRTFIAEQLEGTNAEKAKNILKYPLNFILSGEYTYYPVEANWPWDFYIQNRGEAAQYAISDNQGDYNGLGDYSFSVRQDNVNLESGYAYRGRAAKCRAKNLVSATVTYDANGGTGAPETSTSSPATSHYTFTISSTIPTRSGYTFSGWMDGKGTEVFPNSTFVTTEPETTFYAIWTNNSCNPNATTIGTNNSETDAVCLQDINTTVKSNMTSKETYTLIDARDNKEYTVSLLDDNNIWMTKNLAIGDGTDMLLSFYDTDLESNTIVPLSASDYLTNNAYGNFYSWIVATNNPGTSTYTPTTSICPAGWDLPTNTNYTSLQSAAGFNSEKLPSSAPYSFNTGGGFYSGNTVYNDSNSYLWTSVLYSSSAAYGANVIGSSITTTYSTGTGASAGASRGIRRNIRCIANNGNVTITYYGNGSIDYPVTAPTSIERSASYNEGIVAGNSFIRAHYTFKNWNTRANGNGLNVSPNATVKSLNGNYNLYAQWTPNLVVTYHSNNSDQLTQSFDVRVGNAWMAQTKNLFPSQADNLKISSWNTEPDGSGTTYKLGKSNSAPSSLTEVEHLDLYAQWVQIYSFAYNGNGANKGSITDVQQNDIGAGDSVSLIAPNYSKTGYGFVGWSLDPNATANGNYTIYGPNETIEVTDSFLEDNAVNGVITFYAIWIAPSGTFQSFNTDDYINSPNGTVLALRDERDNNIYTIAKLADNQWWMTENLRLQLAAYGQTTDNKTIVGAKSITDGTVSELTIFNTNNPKEDFLITSTFSEDWKLIGNTGGYNGTSYDKADVNQINIGLGNLNEENETSYFNTSTNAYGAHQDKYWYSYGIMYNYYAATAGHGAWTSVSSGQNTEGSICPLGWRLPSGNANDSDVLNLKSLITSFTSYPTNLVKSGFFYTGPNGSSISINQSTYYRASAERGEKSTYWTSTLANSGTNTSYSYIMTDSMSSSYGSGTSTTHRVHGAAVRCVANNHTTYTVNFDLNGGDTGPESQTFESSTGILEHVTNVIPTRSGYRFVGWIDNHNDIILPNSFYTIANGTSTTFYALWEASFCNPDATTIGTGNTNTDAVCLQDMNPRIKNGMTLKETYSLIDSRDGKTYNVSLLDDDNVWLTENLAFGVDEPRLLTSNDTDIKEGDTFLFPASEETFVTNNYTKPQVYGDETYGYFYSWAAAIASTNTYNSSSSYPLTSICPAHWDLPPIGKYTNLKSYAGFTQAAHLIASPYNFTKTGYRNQSSFTNQGDYVYLWSSTPYSSSPTYYAYAFYAYNNTVGSTSIYKYNGLPVRCVLSHGTMTIHYNKNDNTEYPVYSGTVADQINVEIDATRTNSNNYSRTDFNFTGWNTEPDGSGTAVSADSALSNYGFQDGDEITLYAQWAPRYTIIFHSNDTNNTTSTSYAYLGNNFTTRNSTAFTSVLENSKIGSWNTEPDGSGTMYHTSTQYPVPSITVPTTIDLYAQWSLLYTVVYDGNGADEGVMTNVTHTNVGIGDLIQLYASNYSKAGYGFAGWSFDSNATVNGSSIIYGPNEKALVTSSAAANSVNGVINVYAVWVAPSGTMQDFDCSALNNNEVVALTDTRDKDVYTVAKYIDDANGGSNCWMMENLRLDNTYEENGDTVTVVMDSNNTQGFNGVFTTLADPESQNFSSTTTSNSLYSTSNITGSYQSYRFPRYNNSNTASRSTDPTVTDNRLTTSTYALNDPLYSYGNYYTWAAAAADTSYYYPSIETNITGSSICPKGWHLPTAGANGEYTNLIAINDALSLSNYPLNFVKSGSYSGTTQSNVGTYGYYWSSTIPSYSYSSKAFYYTSQLTISYLSKYIGYSVRCIADTPAPEPDPDPESTAPEEATTESSTDDTIVVDLGNEVEKAENPENKEETENNEDFSKETDELSDEISS